VSFSDLILVGVNHSTCPLDVREAIAFSPEQASEALSELITEGLLKEAIILSTCNRTELYAVGVAHEILISRFAALKMISVQTVESHVYRHSGLSACEHIFRVASGLDSMVLGETQIIGQLKTAHRIAEGVEAVGAVLRTTLQLSYSIAKVIRAKTQVGSNVVSLPSVSLKVARQIFGDLDLIKVSFVGAGEMIRLCAEYFAGSTNAKLFFANRTHEKARELAREFGGEGYGIDSLREQIERADVLISCTSSQTPIIGKPLLEHCLRGRRNRPVLLIDLAVPRDVDKDVAKLRDVFLYTIDDLGEIVRQGQANREIAAKEASKYISDGLLKLEAEFAKRQVSPTIKAFRDFGEKIAEEESANAIRLLAQGKSPEQAIQVLSRSITKKFMHQPSHVINSAEEKSKEDLAEALRTLYRLHT